ncbi:hypothetical protein H0H81_003057 [Sphagnurus paluster]|uniref:Uncharacterized protein n=1 Tax=Sphagnurus paluster TaxID=117069 RepID=A0A9P7FNW5_9AGAR|nr:hypothetical protein H0H81_003057 [Sphagnurus paluster]
MMPKMPARNHPSATKFDGNPKHLCVFFEQIDYLGGEFKLTDSDKIGWTIRYAPTKDIELWKLLKPAKSNSWDDFKQEIYSLYPGSTRDRKYTILDLEWLTEKQATVLIKGYPDITDNFAQSDYSSPLTDTSQIMKLA